MSDTKTPKTPQPSSSQVREIRLKAPRSWSELTQGQLRYVLELMTSAPRPMTEVKTYMFVRFTGIEVKGLYPDGRKCVAQKRVFYLKNWEVESLLHQFDFIETGEDYDTRLDEVQGLRPVDSLLHDVCFLDYLNAEKWYLLYSQKRDSKYLDKLTEILYRPKDEEKTHNSSLITHNYSESERLNSCLWYSRIKAVFRQVFPHLFRPSSSIDEDFNVMASINAQIRILTDGDITKEQAVLDKDCWRALYELDAKAKEADDFKREQAKLKQR